MNDSARSPIRVAELIGNRLAAAGVRYAFGIPGGEVLSLLDGLKMAGVEFILCRHENCGGFMAEGTHHASGAPAVLVATVGPGVANAVNVVVNAYQDRVPMLFLTGCIDEEDQHTYTHQIFDHQELLRGVTKASFRLNVASLEEILDKALCIAFDGQRGPVHLDVPISVAKARIDRPIPVRRAKIMATAPVDKEVTRLGALLERARRPLILAGLDVLAHRAASELQSLAELLGAPVLTTYKAKGVIPETHPLSLGGAGLSPRADAVLLPLVRKADVVVLAGYDPIEMRKGWRSPFREETAVIEISSVPNTHYVHQASCSVVGDIGATLRVLGQRVQKSAGPVWDCGSPESARHSLAAAFARESVFGPARISHALSELIPKHAFVSVDTGAHRIAFNQIYRVQSAGTLLQSSGLCTMGCAVPLAIGAKLAAPLRPAVAVTGDGGLEMALGELATLRDQRLSVVIVVYDDRSLALIEMKQRHLGLSTLGVNSGGTDFVSIAASFGGIGVLVEDEETLRKAVCEALAVEGRFSLLHCRLERASYDDLI